MASADMSIDTILFDAYGTLFDIQGVRAAVAAIAPRPEDFVSAWRRRQLEYSWLRTLMERYVDFAQISADALDATAAGEGIALDPTVRTSLLATWLRPAPYPEVPAALAALITWPLGILSNGSPAMLATVLDTHRIGQSFRLGVERRPGPRLQACNQSLRAGRAGHRHPPRAHPLRFVQCLGCCWRCRVRLRHVLDQPIRCGAGGARSVAGFDRSEPRSTARILAQSMSVGYWNSAI